MFQSAATSRCIFFFFSVFYQNMVITSILNLSILAFIFSSITMELVPAFSVTFFGCKTEELMRAQMQENFIWITAHLWFIRGDNPEPLLPPLDGLAHLGRLEGGGSGLGARHHTTDNTRDSSPSRIGPPASWAPLCRPAPRRSCYLHQRPRPPSCCSTYPRT